LVFLLKRLSKNTNPDLYSSPTPGTPPQEVKKEDQTNENTSNFTTDNTSNFTTNNTNNNIDNNSSPAKVSISLLAANKEGVNYQDNALGKTEVRQFLGKSTVDLTMSETAQSLEFPAGKVENQLLLADVPTTNSLILNINDQQPGFKIPDGLTINGQAITAGKPLTIDVTGMTNNEVPLNLGWEEGSAAASSDFQLTKECSSVEGGSVPLAIGAITPMVRIIIPMVSPCFSIHGKKALSGVTRTIINTRIEIATVVLWLTKPSAARPSSINRVVSSMCRGPCQKTKKRSPFTLRIIA